jgi:hypothetical protein
MCEESTPEEDKATPFLIRVDFDLILMRNQLPAIVQNYGLIFYESI